ncbi:MAG: NAD(P)/FAD-dependent oxidoreductase [Gammaproteobacteria bacterium]|nr:NAD(P)/FAD-dependent oxidoreductase [Gammaproteobacteria bacterium]
MQPDRSAHFDCCIIGAGVVGLAIAHELALRKRSVVILEQEDRHGTGSSARNSEVIHAGIYYPAGSLKATLCVEGRERLYRFCESRGVHHRRIGKLIVAGTQEQHPDLELLQKKASANGVTDLQWIEAKALAQLEPHVSGTSALLSPSTGIVDSHGLMLALLAGINSHGGTLCLKTEFLQAQRLSDGFSIQANSVGETCQIRSEQLINAAGLGAQAVAARIDGLDANAIPPLHLCAGRYFTLSGAAPFTRLIYPLPDAATTGLGIHATLDLQGQVRFGPDTAYIAHEDYRVADDLRADFARAIRRYFPALDESRLIPAYAGIRPKIQGPGAPAQDFRIDQPLPGLINLFGIESPGLTAALAIARHVADRLA